MHGGMKQVGLQMDFFLFGNEPLGLLLFFGDLEAARTGFAKVLDGHKRILARVRQGVASADGYALAWHARMPLSMRALASQCIVNNSAVDQRWL